MKFIKSSWSGYEIDSSEFFAKVTSSSPTEAVKAFFESSHTKSYTSVKILEGMFKVIDIAKKENRELFQETGLQKLEDQYLKKIESGAKVNNVTNFELIKSNYNNIEFVKLCEEIQLTETEILEIVSELELFLQKFPHLIFELHDSIIYFHINAYEGISIPISIVGFPHEFRTHIVDEGSLFDAIEDVKRKGKIEYDSWM